VTAAPRILLAGIGNVFLGDDGFGAEVARRLALRPLPEGVRAVDFGIRGFDLAYALLDGCDAAILIDAVQRGGAPGTLYVIEPEIEPGDEPGGDELLAPHGMHPARVFRMVQAMGGRLGPLRIVGCEPATFGDEDEGLMGLSAPVEAAVDPAVAIVESLARELQESAAHA
jgi:hydrogenase maturation protease